MSVSKEEVGRIRVNGEEMPYKEQTIYELLESMGVDPERQGIAVALNYEIVRREEWRTTKLKPGDVVEIVTAVSGG